MKFVIPFTIILPAFDTVENVVVPSVSTFPVSLFVNDVITVVPVVVIVPSFFIVVYVVLSDDVTVPAFVNVSTVVVPVNVIVASA